MPPRASVARGVPLLSSMRTVASWSRLWVLLAGLLPLGLPWLFPTAPPLNRFVLGFVGWVALSKALDEARGGPDVDVVRGHRARRLLWLLMPPRLSWPDSYAERQAIACEGRARLSWGLAKLAVFSMFWHMQPLGLPPVLLGPAHTLWGLTLCYLALAGIADTVTSLPMLRGVHVAQAFRRPFVARSPRELWHQRWNLWFHRVIGRHVFRPLRRRPALALMSGFVVSGLAHEYLVVAALGHTDFGMLRFFILQGLAVLLQKPLSRRLGVRLAAPLAWGLHGAWLLLTAPLLLVSAFRIAGVTTPTLW